MAEIITAPVQNGSELNNTGMAWDASFNNGQGGFVSIGGTSAGNVTGQNIPPPVTAPPPPAPGMPPPTTGTTPVATTTTTPTVSPTETTVAAPADTNTLRPFAASKGYEVKYDSASGLATVTNPKTGLSVTFNEQTAAQYGIGKVVNQQFTIDNYDMLQSHLDPNYLPENSLKAMAESNGYKLAYDPATNSVTVTNPASGKTITFPAGKGEQYGIGGLTQIKDGGAHIVTDAEKLILALSADVVDGKTDTDTNTDTDTDTGGETGGDVAGGESLLTKTTTTDKLSAPPAYVGKYDAKMEQLIKEIENSKFSYNPETDILWQQAKKDIASSVKAAMNARGILGSTITSDRITQVMASALPEYEARAFAKYQQELDKLSKVFDMVSTLDDKQYQRFTDAWQMNYQATTANWERQNQQFSQQMQQFEAALKKVDAVGYVDNETSLLLGLPVGTPSKAAREYIQQKEDAIMFKNLDYNLQLAIEKWRSQQEKEMLDLRAEKDKEIFAYQQQITQAFQREMAAYDLDSWFKKADYQQVQALQTMMVEQDYWTKRADYSQKLDLEKMATANEYDKLMAAYGASLDASLFQYKQSFESTGQVDLKLNAKNMSESVNTIAAQAAIQAANATVGQTVNGKVVSEVKWNSATNTATLLDSGGEAIPSPQQFSASNYTTQGMAQYMGGLAELYPAAIIGQMVDEMTVSDPVTANAARPYVYALAVIDKILVDGDDAKTSENLELAFSNPAKLGIPGDTKMQLSVLDALNYLINYTK